MNEEVASVDHIGRNVGKQKIVNGKPTGAAFQLRDNEPLVSGDCLERVHQDRATACKLLFSKILPARNLTPRGAIAWFNYGAAKVAMPTGFRAEYDMPTDPTHIGMNLPSLAESDSLAEMCQLIDGKTGLPWQA